jgi:hypothetical protein
MLYIHASIGLTGREKECVCIQIYVCIGVPTGRRRMFSITDSETVTETQEDPEAKIPKSQTNKTQK